MKDFGKVGEGKDRGLGHGLLEFMKGFRSCLGPGEISFLEAIGDGGSDGAETFYELR